MKRHQAASTAFYQGLAQAGMKGMKLLGESLAKVGRGFATEDAPMDVLGDAILGAERARWVLTDGAIVAAKLALAEIRQPDRLAPEFKVTSADTLALTGTVSYDALKIRMKDSGFVPAQLIAGKKERYGVVHIYVNDIKGSTLGAYKELFIMACAFPEGSPKNISEVKAADLGTNPYFVWAAAFRPGATNFVLKLLVKGPDKVIEFGREELGLDKSKGELQFQIRKEGKSTVEVKERANGTQKKVLHGDLALKGELAKAAPLDLARALGITLEELLKLPPPSGYPVVTRLHPGEAMKEWSWVLDPPLVPTMNRIKDNSIELFGDSPVGHLLATELGFKPKVAAWTFGGGGHVAPTKPAAGPVRDGNVAGKAGKVEARAHAKS